MWTNFLWVGLGGFAGSVLRYGTGLLTAQWAVAHAGKFPVATFTVNVLGSFVIGILLRHFDTASTAHLLGVVGFCGGFTTFSSFSAESLSLFRSGNHTLAFVYIFGSFLLCLGAVWLGMLLKTTR